MTWDVAVEFGEHEADGEVPAGAELRGGVRAEADEVVLAVHGHPEARVHEAAGPPPQPSHIGDRGAALKFKADAGLPIAAQLHAVREHAA